jgi:AraC-like DNA-binding protein
MYYEEFSPAPFLRKFIKCYWFLEGPARPDAALERIVPDGCTELVFHLGDPFVQYKSDDSVDRQPLSLVVGQMHRYILIKPSGAVRVLGVRFWPGGSYSLLGVPQHELADNILTLEALLGRFGRELHERLGNISNASKAVNELERSLGSRFGASDGGGDKVLLATAAILNTGGRVSITTLADHLCISLRQLDRQFKERVGSSPKMLCRLSRFQKLLQMVERLEQGTGWARLAVECGYYDQSHLIRDFRSFAGREPTAYMTDENSMSGFFIRQADMSVSYNTGVDPTW